MSQWCDAFKQCWGCKSKVEEHQELSNLSRSIRQKGSKLGRERTKKGTKIRRSFKKNAKEKFKCCPTLGWL